MAAGMSSEAGWGRWCVTGTRARERKVAVRVPLQGVRYCRADKLRGLLGRTPWGAAPEQCPASVVAQPTPGAMPAAVGRGCPGPLLLRFSGSAM